MSKYDTVKDLPDGKFRRLTGIKHKTFLKMIEILKKAEALKRAKGGRPNALCVEDRLLMTLEYNREYRTYFHIGKSYGLSESNSYYAIKWIEDVLIKDGEFALPGKKALLDDGADFAIVSLDASETPIERPKKDNADGTPAKRNAIP